jgi:hypothetical protein
MWQPPSNTSGSISESLDLDRDRSMVVKREVCHTVMTAGDGGASAVILRGQKSRLDNRALDARAW